jgi:integral membrane protein
VIRQLRLLSVAEATSYLMLLGATAIEQTGGSTTGVSVIGPVHGVLYLSFVAAVAWRRTALCWPWPKAFTAMIIGSVPLGGFWLERNWLAPLESDRNRPVSLD